MKIIFIVDKNLTLFDFVQLTGIKQRNMWFDYFIQKFSSMVMLESFSSLLKYCNTTLNKSISLQAIYFKQFDIDGDTFIDKKCWILDYNTFNIDLQTLLTSRKVKVVTIDD